MSWGSHGCWWATSTPAALAGFLLLGLIVPLGGECWHQSLYLVQKQLVLRGDKEGAGCRGLTEQKMLGSAGHWRITGSLSALTAF